MVNADFTLTIKLGELFINPNSSDDEIELKLIQEGEKRLRHYLSGYLLDPDKKIILKNLEIYATK